MSFLIIQNITKIFGGLIALRDVSFEVKQSEILGLIGPNGAGKSTLFSIISGFQQPDKGKIIFKNKEITGLGVDRIARMGISRIFQEPTLFMQETAFENVFSGFHRHYSTNALKACLHTPSSNLEEKLYRHKTFEILDFMGLAELSDELACNLPHGLQRALAIAIALACKPDLLLLDEPVTGMNPSETAIMIEKIRQIRNQGITVLIVEHDMRAVMSLCDRIIVLNLGVNLVEGSPDKIRNDERVIEAYLGKQVI